MTNTFIEVFAGCGGLSLGLTKAGFTPLLLVDNNKDCIATLKANHPHTSVELQDVSVLHLDDYKNKVCILAGGIPCQSWSYAGKRQGLDDPRGQLFYHFIRLIRECQPTIILIENVQGLLTHNKGQTFEMLKTLLSIDGTYNIQHKLLNSNDYNVPQIRKRVIIIGTKVQDNLLYKYPEPYNPNTTLEMAFKNIPFCVEGQKYSANKLKWFIKIPEGGCVSDLTKEEQQEYLGKLYKGRGGKSGVLKRLQMNKPSPTLLCCPTQKLTERCHPIEHRPLNIMEYSRIQTFPDDYKLCGSTTSKYKQLGNAVPVNLAYHIGLSIKNIL